MNTYSTSKGERFLQTQIDRKIREAKSQTLQNQIENYGYNFCEQCGHNGSGTRLDCSHEMSVKRAKEEGKTEQAWNVKNIVIRCRKCHQKHDKLNVQFKQ
ncbi:hypothetical protein [Flavobacterium kingsejongi]|uniref:HNH nuclease domain-containing protein n=1 Tax=Flavobacterium kingsejongi TaxID=1678728 RepID=A0A2S1LQJ6_9FLAO|nr:hypothetical protein [Flavobacterium kingsejongi]AWG26025.1 hypothetical protein FK004_12715 [Flavobacterium kingsejongi]